MKYFLTMNIYWETGPTPTEESPWETEIAFPFMTEGPWELEKHFPFPINTKRYKPGVKLVKRYNVKELQLFMMGSERKSLTERVVRLRDESTVSRGN